MQTPGWIRLALFIADAWIFLIAGIALGGFGAIIGALLGPIGAVAGGLGAFILGGWLAVKLTSGISRKVAGIGKEPNRYI